MTQCCHLFTERHVHRASACSPLHDVRRLWSDTERFAGISQVGIIRQLFEIRTGGLRWSTFLQPRTTTVRCFLLSLQVSMQIFPQSLEFNLIFFFAIRYPEKFLREIAMEANQYWFDIAALLITLTFLRVVCYFILKWRIVLSR